MLVLQKEQKMSQKFVWSPESILDCDVGYITGLLEDLHRLSDGVAPRKRGVNYHKPGPYYGV